MTFQSVTVWTCDRCGTGETKPMTTAPEGWVSVLVVDPPRAIPDNAERRQLCDICTREFEDLFMQGKATPKPWTSGQYETCDCG